MKTAIRTVIGMVYIARKHTYLQIGRFILLITILSVFHSAFQIVEPESFCSGYFAKSPSDGSIYVQGPYDLHSQAFVRQGSGFFCKLGQFCVQDDDLAPEWTYLNFFNIYYAMVNMFTIISIEDWSYVMYDVQDGTSTIGSPIFFCLCVYFMSFIMAPLFIGMYN
jgi:hypothetical protein